MLFSRTAVQRLFLAVWVIFFAAVAQAEESPNELCESLALMAKSIMRARQSGVEMSALIRKADENIKKDNGDGESKKIGEVAKEYIRDVYEYPFVYHEDIRKEVVVEYGNRIYLMCYNTKRKLRS